jgi:hypothetical protein
MTIEALAKWMGVNVRDAGCILRDGGGDVARVRAILNGARDGISKARNRVAYMRGVIRKQMGGAGNPGAARSNTRQSQYGGRQAEHTAPPDGAHFFWAPVHLDGSMPAESEFYQRRSADEIPDEYVDSPF